MQVNEEPQKAAQNVTPEASFNTPRTRLYSALVYLIARFIYGTLRMNIENLERIFPPGGTPGEPVASGKATPGMILVAWHGRSLIPANVLRNRDCWALISLSRDGEVQNGVFKRFGFHTVRGSTKRGGVRGALQMARKVKEGGVLAFTPDGPRGPSHKVQPGVILMAEKSGAPIVPIGASASRRWLLGSWDRYMIPQPFARGYFLAGEPIYVPPGLDEAARQAVALQVECALNRIEREAEARAGHLDYPAEWQTQEPAESTNTQKASLQEPSH